VPDDLLRHLFGPQPYSSSWLWVAVLLIITVISWYAVVFVWTLPSHRLRRIPIARRLHAWLIRDRFARRVQLITDQYAAGSTTGPAACAAISRTVRSFLHQATGARAQYLQVDAIADGDLAAAAPLLTQLGDGQFNAETHIDVAAAGSQAQELIRAWT
jgi:hypothetical protein